MIFFSEVCIICLVAANVNSRTLYLTVLGVGSITQRIEYGRFENFSVHITYCVIFWPQLLCYGLAYDASTTFKPAWTEWLG